MKTAVNLYFQAGDSANKLRLIKAAGYDEFFTGIALAQETMPWAEQCAYAAKLGLPVNMIHCRYNDPILNHFWLPDELGEQITADYIEQIHACGGKTQNFVVHLHHDAQTQTTPVGMARLRRLLAACEPYQLNLCVENLYSPTEIPEIFRTIKHPLLKICYDSGHCFWLTPEFNLVQDYHQFISVLHLHENDGTRDEHRILTPCSPVFQRLAREIPLLNPDVVLAAEIKVPQGDPAEILQKNYRALRALSQAAGATHI